MKKLLIIAVASSFLFISCTKDAPTQPAQPTTHSAAQNAPVNNPVVNPGPPNPLSAQQLIPFAYISQRAG